MTLNTPPPHVTPVLQIGFSGHRDLSAADSALLQARLRDVLAEITTAARAALADGWPRLSAEGALAALELRGICALAAGADRVAAQAILTAGWPLVAPLPFARELYRNDFTPEKAAEYDALLPHCVTVHELDGIPGRADAYRAVGHLILEQSDIVIALWDGNPERGPGGTGEVVREARAADIPVIVIDAAAPHAVRLLAAAGVRDIADQVRALLAPPGKSGGVDGLDVYYREKTRSVPRLALRLSRIERLLLAFRKPAAIPAPEAQEPVPGGAAADAGFQAAQAVLNPALEAADHLAVRYATLYRASITLRWLAVFPSAFAALVLIYVRAPWAAPLSLIATAVSLITFVIGFNDKHSGWHRRFLDYRFMAEHLRYAPLMAMFGSTRTLPRLPPYQAAVNSDWVNWYLRFALRKLGLVAARRDAAFLARIRQLLARQIGEQIAFYAARTADAQVLASRLRFATMVAYFAATGLTILGGVLKWTGVHDVEAAKASLVGGGAITSALGALFLLAASATVFGMIWPAISGFRAQREYYRLSQRYEAMLRQLGQIEVRLARDGSSPGQVERVAREAVEAMLSEVSDWRVLIKARDFSAY